MEDIFDTFDSEDLAFHYIVGIDLGTTITVNMLCSDAFTDMGAGATYQSTWLDVAAWMPSPRIAGEGYVDFPHIPR